jgi:hypothetical protein
MTDALPPPLFLGLLRRRVCLLPTWRGWLVLAILAVSLAVALVRGVYGFLAVRDPRPGGVLVVEGWAPDEALAWTLEEFRRQHYDGLFITGGPLDVGGFLSEYHTYAELGHATLLRLGADPDSLHMVPAPQALQDRTYASAVALRDWLAAHHFAREKVNLISIGSHTRRSRLLYEFAFGPGTQIGAFAYAEGDFDPAHWWRTSQGFRVVTGEIIAYIYARLLFHPAN